MRRLALMTLALVGAPLAGCRSTAADPAADAPRIVLRAELPDPPGWRRHEVADGLEWRPLEGDAAARLTLVQRPVPALADATTRPALEQALTEGEGVLEHRPWRLAGHEGWRVDGQLTAGDETLRWRRYCAALGDRLMVLTAECPADRWAATEPMFAAAAASLRVSRGTSDDGV